MLSLCQEIWQTPINLKSRGGQAPLLTKVGGPAPLLTPMLVRHQVSWARAKLPALNSRWPLNKGKNNRKTLIGTAKGDCLMGILYAIFILTGLTWLMTDRSKGDGCSISGRLTGFNCIYLLRYVLLIDDIHHFKVWHWAGSTVHFLF